MIDEVTNDWIEHYKNPKNRHGIAWEFALAGFLPHGVDPDNPEVIEILNSDKQKMSKEISVSDLKSVCPFCGGNWEYNAYFSPDGLVVSCKDCGAIVDAHIADARPTEDAIRARVEMLEQMVEKFIGLGSTLIDATSVAVHPKECEEWFDATDEWYGAQQ